MKEKRKKLRYLWIVLFAIAFAIANPKIAKAANENTKFQNAKEIPFEQSITEKYSKEDLKHQSRYYKFTVPKNIGNKWTCIRVNNREATTSVYLYDDKNRRLDYAPLLGTNDYCVFDEEHDTRYYKFTVPKDIGNKWIDIYVINRRDIAIYSKLYNDNMQTLDENEEGVGRDDSVMFHNAIDESAHTRDMVKLKAGSTYYIGVQSYDEKDFELFIRTLADDNWGSSEKAPEIKCNTWKKGVLEYDDDVDRYFVKLPKDKKQHTFIISSDRYIEATFEDANERFIDCISTEANETNSEYSEIGRGQRVYIKIQGDQYANYKIKVTSPIPKKTISTLKVYKCKKGMKVVKGKTISKATVKVKVGNKIYTGSSNAKGTFAIKTKKLVTGQEIKVTVSKSGYKTRTSTIIVKKK